MRVELGSAHRLQEKQTWTNFFFLLNKTIKTLLFPVKMESAVEIGEENIKRLNDDK